MDDYFIRQQETERAGQQQAEGEQHIALPAGTLDTTFGSSGGVVIDFGEEDEARALAIQPDGKIVVAGLLKRGLKEWGFAVARYHPSGTLDPSFGKAGKVIFALDYGAAYALAVQKDGKIVVGGTSGHSPPSWLHPRGRSSSYTKNFTLVRLSTNGKVDTKFGRAGMVATDFLGGSDDEVRDLALQADGKIVAVGRTVTHGDRGRHDIALARYHGNGGLDRSFGTNGNGRVTTSFSGGFDEAEAVCIQEDGKIVVAGSAMGNPPNFALVRYDADGRLDPDFGQAGKVTTDLGQASLAPYFISSTDDRARDLTIQEDGKLVVVGKSGSGIGEDMALVRYLPDGSLDTDFGYGGMTLTNIGGKANAGHAVALQPDGKIVAAGYANPGNMDFALARYLSDGSLDPTFGHGGIIATDFGGESDIAYAVALQADGKIVAAGQTGFVSSNPNFALARYINPIERSDARTFTPDIVPQQPMNDAVKADFFMEVQRRQMAAMSRAMPGTANEAVVEEFKAIYASYNQLLQTGAPEQPLYSITDVQRSMADVLEWIARSYDSMRDVEQANHYYKKAVDAFQVVGDQESVARNRQNIAQLGFEREGSIDQELVRLRTKPSSIPTGSLQHAIALVELGQLYMRSGDDFASETQLKNAMVELERMGHPDPSGVDAREMLNQTVQDLMTGKAMAGTTRFETLTAVRGAYQHIYQCLSTIYADRGELDKAARYFQMFEQVSANELKGEDIFGTVRKILDRYGDA